MWARVLRRWGRRLAELRRREELSARMSCCVSEEDGSPLEFREELRREDATLLVTQGTCNFMVYLKLPEDGQRVIGCRVKRT